MRLSIPPAEWGSNSWMASLISIVVMGLRRVEKTGLGWYVGLGHVGM